MARGRKPPAGARSASLRDLDFDARAGVEPPGADFERVLAAMLTVATPAVPGAGAAAASRHVVGRVVAAVERLEGSSPGRGAGPLLDVCGLAKLPIGRVRAALRAALDEGLVVDVGAPGAESFSAVVIDAPEDA